MLNVKWTMDNDGRLVATWNIRNQGYVVPSYLTAETAVHAAGSAMTSAKARPWARATQVWNWLRERVSEFAGEPPLPRQVADSKVTGLFRNRVMKSVATPTQPCEGSEPAAFPTKTERVLLGSTAQQANAQGRFWKQRAAIIVLLWAVSFLLPAVVALGEGGGKITGAVTDQTGAVLPGATVVLLNTATGVSQTTATNDDGKYTFPVVAVAQYEVKATSTGFRPYRQTGLVIDTGFRISTQRCSHRMRSAGDRVAAILLRAGHQQFRHRRPQDYEDQRKQID
jgi:hypothetical protein